MLVLWKCLLECPAHQGKAQMTFNSGDFVWTAGRLATDPRLGRFQSADGMFDEVIWMILAIGYRKGKTEYLELEALGLTKECIKNLMHSARSLAKSMLVVVEGRELKARKGHRRLRLVAISSESSLDHTASTGSTFTTWTNGDKRHRYAPWHLQDGATLGPWCACPSPRVWVPRVICGPVWIANTPAGPILHRHNVLRPRRPFIGLASDAMRGAVKQHNAVCCKHGKRSTDDSFDFGEYFFTFMCLLGYLGSRHSSWYARFLYVFVVNREGIEAAAMLSQYPR